MSSKSAPSAGSSRPKVNLRSTAVKRIMQEANELSDPAEQDFTAAPLETDIFEWHCTMRGVAGSEFEEGLYHFRIILPPSYPMSAPDIILLTPNGRFELGKKICIDGLTSFHAGSWQPAWGVRTALRDRTMADWIAILGLRSFWMQGGEALSAIGALDCSMDERKRLAKLSKEWMCPTCNCRNDELLPEAQIRSTVAHDSSNSAEDKKIDRESGNADTNGTNVERPGMVSELGTSDISTERRAGLNSGHQPGGEHIESPSKPSWQTLQPSLPAHTTTAPISDTLSSGQADAPQNPSPPPSTALSPTSTLHPNSALSESIRNIPRPSPIPIPTPPFSSAIAIPPPPLRPSQLQSRRGVPLWLDALICACCAMLVLILARKAVLGGGRDEGNMMLRDDL